MTQANKRVKSRMMIRLRIYQLKKWHLLISSLRTKQANHQIYRGQWHNKNGKIPTIYKIKTILRGWLTKSTHPRPLHKVRRITSSATSSKRKRFLIIRVNRRKALKEQKEEEITRASKIWLTLNKRRKTWILPLMNKSH